MTSVLSLWGEWMFTGGLSFHALDAKTRLRDHNHMNNGFGTMFFTCTIAIGKGYQIWLCSAHRA